MEFDTSDDDLDSLAYKMARDLEVTRNNYEKLLNFIIAVDEFVCDLEFTVALRDKLNDIIAVEGE